MYICVCKNVCVCAIHRIGQLLVSACQAAAEQAGPARAGQPQRGRVKRFTAAGSRVKTLQLPSGIDGAHVCVCV